MHFTQQAIERVAENRIREAVAQGRFDNLAGAGKPIADLDEPFDELWWVRRWVRRENLTREMPRALARAVRELRNARS